MIKPRLAARNGAVYFVHCKDDGIKKFSCHPDNPYSKKNIKRTEGADFHHFVKDGRNLNYRIKLFGKADDEVVDVRINAENSNKNCKDNHHYRNEGKNKTKGTGRSTFP